MGEVIRSFTLTLWNVYSFFVTYANLDKPTVTTMPIATSDLDRWLLSELNVLVRNVTEAYENYDVTNGTRPIEAFVEKMSTWYLRRSRRRFPRRLRRHRRRLNRECPGNAAGSAAILAAFVFGSIADMPTRATTNNSVKKPTDDIRMVLLPFRSRFPDWGMSVV